MEAKYPKYSVGSRVRIVSARTPQGFAKYPELEPYVNAKGTVVKTESIRPIMLPSMAGTDPLNPPPTSLFYVYTVHIDKHDTEVRTLEESLKASSD